MDKIIVINATNIGHRLDGIGVYTLNLLKALSKSETNLGFVIFCNRNCEQHIRDIKFPENFSIRYVSRLVSPDYGFRGHFLRLVFSNFLSLRYRENLIFNTSQIEAAFFGSNQIVTIHDVIPLLFNQHHHKQYYYYKYPLKYALSKARAIITPSNHTKGLLERTYGLSGKKIFAIHNGLQEVFLSQGHCSTQDKETYILYVGRLSPTKNIRGLIKAFRLVKDRLPHKLLLAGAGKEELLKDREFKDIFEDVGEKVIFRGHVLGGELLDLFNKASLFVFPSLYEGFGFPPLEAMACGTPVLVSNVSSLPEVCGDAAYYIDPYSVESIAEGIYNVLTDNALRHSLIQKGLEKAKCFSWEKSAREHIKVFEEVLGS